MQRSINEFFNRPKANEGQSNSQNQDDETKLDSKSDCDANNNEPVAKKAKRIKKFQQKWLNEFNWLHFEDEKMYCNMCVNASSVRKSLQSNKFVCGTNNFQRSALTRHMDTDDHILARKTQSERNYMSAARKVVTSSSLPLLEAQIRTATMMAEENIPNRKFLKLIDLQVNFHDSFFFKENKLSCNSHLSENQGNRCKN